MPDTKRHLGFWSSLLAAPHAAGATTLPAAAGSAAPAGQGHAQPVPESLLNAREIPQASRPALLPLLRSVENDPTSEEAAPRDFTNSRPVRLWPPAWML